MNGAITARVKRSCRERMPNTLLMKPRRTWKWGKERGIHAVVGNMSSSNNSSSSSRSNSNSSSSSNNNNSNNDDDDDDNSNSSTVEPTATAIKHDISRLYGFKKCRLLIPLCR